MWFSGRLSSDRASAAVNHQEKSVCLLTSSTVPGRSANAIQSMAMARAFAECGYQVVLACQHSQMTYPGAASQLSELEQAGVRIHYLPSRKDTPVAGYVHAYQCFRDIRRLNVPLVHSRCLLQGVLLALAGCRVTCEIHQVDNWKELKPLLWSQGLLRIRAIVAISQGLANAIRARGVLAEKLVVLHDGVDLSMFERHLCKEGMGSGKSKAEFLLGYFGSIGLGRGVETLLEAAIATPWLRIKLVGRITDLQGDRLDRIQKLIDRAGSRVEWLGQVPHVEVPALMRSCDALAISYTTELRTVDVMSPLKVFEYMASGRPIVSTQVGTLREVLREGENCLAFQPGDPRSLVEALARLRRSPELSQRLSETTRSDVCAYTWRARAERILELLDGVR